MTKAGPARRATDQPDTMLWLLRGGAVLTVLVLAWQFVTAGQLISTDSAQALHSTGAVVLHVVTGLVAIAAFAYWRATRGPAWPLVLAVVVFALSFVQAYFGDHSTLAIHVPGALVLTVGAVWLAAWTFTGARR